MASPKKQRKRAKIEQKTRHPQSGPHRHPDGDRRRRDGIRVEDAIAHKRAMQQFYGAPPPDPEEEEDEEAAG